MATTLIIPGLHSSGPDHWQSWFESRLDSSVRVIQREWRDANLAHWSQRVRRDIHRSPGRVFLVAHSFGVLAAVQAGHDHRQRIAGALFVAPADPDTFGVADFLPTQPLGFPSVVVASENDPWMASERAAYWADHWGSDFVNLGKAGHINAEAGFGASPASAREGVTPGSYFSLSNKVCRINSFDRTRVRDSPGVAAPFRLTLKPPPKRKNMMFRSRTHTVLPGFGLSLGFTLIYLSLIVLIPLSAVFAKTAGMDWEAFWRAVASPRVVASYELSFGVSLLAAAINAVFGLLLAWGLVRYTFPGKKLVDALIDLPFALATAVAGVSLTALYSKNGWLGRYLEPLGVKVAFGPLGVLVALVFIGLPFIVRTVQPILEDIDTELEEAAASLGATRGQAVRRVVLPLLAPAILTGFALAFARAVGEYGSVIFIAGNIPFVSEITPLIIITKLEQYDYKGATAVASVMLIVSFVLLLIINGLQAWISKRMGRQ